VRQFVPPQPAPAQPVRPSIAPPPAGRAAATPQEAIQQHWSARDASTDMSAMRNASRQECADVDAIRSRHGLPPASAEPARSVEPPPPVAQESSRRPAKIAPAEDPHGVFDRMAASLSYANTFDAGDVRLQRRFDEMNAVLDGEARKATRRSEQAVAASRPQDMDDLSLMKDLVSLRDKLGTVPEGEMKEPPGPLPEEVTAVLPAPDVDAPSLQQDLASLRARLGSDIPPEELKEPPGPLPPAAIETVTLEEAPGAS
jgi:hypothetical protein